jgi:hypothetical protein
MLSLLRWRPARVHPASTAPKSRLVLPRSPGLLFLNSRFRSGVVLRPTARASRRSLSVAKAPANYTIQLRALRSLTRIAAHSVSIPTQKFIGRTRSDAFRRERLTARSRSKPPQWILRINSNKVARLRATASHGGC